MGGGGGGGGRSTPIESWGLSVVYVEWSGGTYYTLAIHFQHIDMAFSNRPSFSRTGSVVWKVTPYPPVMMVLSRPESIKRAYLMD